MADEAIRVKVVCRVRPLNEKERASGDEAVVRFPSASSVALGVRRQPASRRFFITLSVVLREALDCGHSILE